MISSFDRQRRQTRHLQTSSLYYVDSISLSIRSRMEETYNQGSEKQREALRNTKSVAKRNAFRSGTLCETATETKKRSATQSETAMQIRKRSATSSETETLFRNSFRNAKILLRNEILFSLAFYCFSH